MNKKNESAFADSFGLFEKMNFQQLRYVRETVRRNLNLTEAAHALFTSQPGVSKQIKELEEELGVEIFARRGRRFIGLTEPGKAVLTHRRTYAGGGRQPEARRRGVRGPRLRQPDHRHDPHPGALLAAARGRRVPQALSRRSGSRSSRASRSRSSRCSSAAMPTSASRPNRSTTPPRCSRCPATSGGTHVVVPADHPLAGDEAAHARGARQVADHHLQPRVHRPLAHRRGVRRRAASPYDVVLTAIDSDVIKTYVELGLGVGIIAAMAFDPVARCGTARARCEPSVSRQHHPRRHPARYASARIRLRLHRALRAAAHAQGHRARGGGRGTAETFEI